MQLVKDETFTSILFLINENLGETCPNKARKREQHPTVPAPKGKFDYVSWYTLILNKTDMAIKKMNSE